MDSKYISGIPEIARFDFTHTNQAGTDKTADRINQASEYLFNVGYGDHFLNFSDLNKKQKLDVVAQYLDDVIRDTARLFKLARAEEAAKLAANAEFDTTD